MTVYDWPDGVNKKAYGVTEIFLDNVQREDTDSGLPLQWAKNTWTPRKWSLSLHMTKKEYGIFNAWWRNTLNGGASPFRFPNLSCDGTYATYMMTSAPDPKGTQGWRDVRLEFVEALA